MKFKVSLNTPYTGRQWQRLADVEARSMAMARCIAYQQIPESLGPLGSLQSTRRPVKGRTIYDYDHGMLCVERLG